MGLLDQFGSLNEDQTQGLLAAASSMLQNSGPSRTPAGFGQIVGGGLEAYQGSTIAAKKRKMEQEHAKNLAAYQGLQMQEMQGNLQDSAAKRAEAARFQQVMSNYGTPEARKFDAQSQFLGGDMSPTLANAAKLDQMPQPPTGAQGGLYEELMAKAQYLQSNGFPAQAEAAMKEAISARPKFANEPRTVMGLNGKPMLVQMADDGTVRPIQGGYGVAEKLHFGDAGGSIDGLNQYTGERVSSTRKTQSPDSLASNSLGWANYGLSKQRFNEERSKEARPTFNSEAGGFIVPPSEKAPSGAIIPLAGLPAKPPTESQGKALTFYARMADAEQSIKALEKNGISGKDLSTIAAGNNWMNFLSSSGGQTYRQAQENWVTANLRQESGAAIGVDEMAKDVRKYFPVPGDDAPVIAQKARAREIATQGMRAQAGKNGGERADAIVANAQPKVAAPTMEAKPTPNASNKGKVLIEHQTGKRFKSNGLQWIEVQ